MKKALFILDSEPFEHIYGREHFDAIASLVDVYAPPQTAQSVKERPGLLHDAEIIFSGWGGPVMDEAFLAAAPKLKAFFYGAGSIRDLVTEAFWNRDIMVTTAVAANAVPVAEYTLSQILFGLKCGWQYAIRYKKGDAGRSLPSAGGYRSTVGLISLGTIGRLVCGLLRPFDVHVIAYDPFISPTHAEALRVELCPLAEVFRRADVVSLHTPNLPETRGMITGGHLASMKQYSTFINTARGAVVRQEEMIEVLKRRPDLAAVLDVTWPETLESDAPLLALENVIRTPHVAGSMGPERRRMGQYMVEELKRYLAGEPLTWGVTRERFALMA